MTHSEHFQHLANLLDLEGRFEQWQLIELAKTLTPVQLEERGLGITRLIVRDEDSGLGGHVLLTLAKANAPRLPWLRLADGAPVQLKTPGLRRPLRGVMAGRNAMTVRVAIPEIPDELDTDSEFDLLIAADETSRLRQSAALRRAATAKDERFVELRSILLGERPCRFDAESEFTPFNSGLNESQMAAIRFALSAKDVAVIHGPPGTGKTTTLAELIRQAVARGERVLVCAPSNLAVDNLIERIAVTSLNVVRLGHPARVLASLQACTLDARVEKHPIVRQARKLAREASALFREADRFTRAKPEPGARRAMRAEARLMYAASRQAEDEAVEHVLNGAQVIGSTLTGLDPNLLGTRTFDLLVIDEAGQGTEPAAWIGVLRARRVVFAGDHCQLPPTVLSPESQRGGLGISLMERLLAVHSEDIARMLAVQYRMHRDIAAFSSAEFYRGELAADDSVAGHLLSGLPDVSATDLTATAVTFFDTAGAGFDEDEEEAGESRRNPREADLVVRLVRELLDAGVPLADIAVISPYSAQVRLIRERCRIPDLEIDSIDGFQGRESEAVIISTVRSNPRGEIGFLSDIRRVNVALTRARRKLIVVGDSATLSSHVFYQRMIEYFETIGAYRSVWELE